MKWTQKLSVSGVLALTVAWAAAAMASGDRYPSENGEIVVVPIKESSFVLQVPGLVIYNDPAGGKRLFEGQPPADLVLICHEHEDHFDIGTLEVVMGVNTRLVVNPATLQLLPNELKARAVALANGESTRIGSVEIEAIPAYHLSPAYTKYHPQGRDNGYLLSVDGRRIYISGDADAIPEMRALQAIDIAFLSISRWTLTAEQGASAVASFKPTVVYPYHYQSRRERDDFASRVQAGGGSSRVVLRDW